MTSGGWDLAALAARLRHDSDDLSLYAGLLITILAGSLPLEAKTIWAGTPTAWPVARCTPRQ